jgi:hypothetical protein
VTVNDTIRELVSPLRVSLAKTQPMIIYALDYVQAWGHVHVTNIVHVKLAGWNVFVLTDDLPPQNVNNKPWEYIMYKDKYVRAEGCMAYLRAHRCTWPHAA